MLAYYLSSICLISCSKITHPEITTLKITEQYRCIPDSNCCAKGYNLSELVLPVSIKNINYNNKSKLFDIEGLVNLGNKMSKIYVAGVLGEISTELICEKQSLGMVNDSTGSFSYSFRVNKNNEVFYFQAVGYEPYILKIGSLLNH